MLFCQNTPKTGNNAVKMSLPFQDITQFESFTGLNLLEYAFSVIAPGKQMLYNFIPWCLFFVSSYDSFVVEGDESSRPRMANWPVV